MKHPMSLEEWLRLSEPPFMDGGAEPHRDAGDLLTFPQSEHGRRPSGE